MSLVFEVVVFYDNQPASDISFCTSALEFEVVEFCLFQPTSSIRFVRCDGVRSDCLRRCSPHHSQRRSL